MEASAVQGCLCLKTHRIECLIVSEKDSLGDLIQSDSAYAAYDACEVLIYYVLADSDSLENLCRLVRLQCGDTHLCRCLNDAVKDRIVIIVDCRVVILVDDSLVDHLSNALVCKVRIDRTRTESEQSCHLVNVTGLAALDDEGYGRSLSCLDQMLLNCGNSEE